MGKTTQQYQINLAITADAKAAKKELDSLHSQLNKIAETTMRRPEFKLSGDLQQATADATKLQAVLKNAINTDTGKLDLTKFSQSLKMSETSLKQYQESLVALGPAGEQAFINLSNQILRAEIPLKRTNKVLDGFWNTLKNTARWELSSGTLHALEGSIKTAYYYSKDLNKSLNDIRIVTEASADHMAAFAVQANKAAKNLSTTTDEFAKASLIYFQQGGMTEAEIMDRTNATIKMAQVTGDSVELVSNQLTAVWNNFYDGTKSLEYYADVMTKLGAVTASSTDEISEGVNKFASIANTIGLSYEYAASALATVTATTRESADVVGNAFKTLFARLQGLQLGETLDDGVTLNKYSKALETIGISLFDANGQVKDMDELLNELGDRWDKIGKAEQIAFAQTAAGVRQYAQLIALLDNWDTFQENLATSYASEGTLSQQAEIYADSWEASEKRVRASAERIYDALIDEDFFIGFNDTLSAVLEGLGDFIDGIGGLPGVLLALGGTFSILFKDKIGSGLNSMTTSLKEQQKAAAQLRYDTTVQLQNMTLDGSNGVRENTREAYALQGQAQQYLIDNAEKLNKVQLDTYNLMLDQHQTLVDTIAKEELELEIEKQKFEQLQKTADLAREKARGTTKYRTKDSIDNAISKIQELKGQDLGMDELGQYFEDNFLEPFAEFDEVLGRTDLDYNKKFEEIASGALSVSDFLNGMEGSLLGYSNTLDQELKKEFPVLGVHEEKLQEISDKTKRLETLKGNLTKQVDRFKTSVDEAEPPAMHLGDAISYITAAASKMAMAGRGIINIVNVFKDDELSNWEKFEQIVSNITLTLPLLVSAFKVLTDKTGGSTLATMLDSAANWLNAKSHKDKSDAIKEETKALDDNTKAQVEETASDVADAAQEALTGSLGKKRGKHGYEINTDAGTIDPDGLRILDKVTGKKRFTNDNEKVAWFEALSNSGKRNKNSASAAKRAQDVIAAKAQKEVLEEAGEQALKTGGQVAAQGAKSAGLLGTLGAKIGTIATSIGGFFSALAPFLPVIIGVTAAVGALVAVGVALYNEYNKAEIAAKKAAEEAKQAQEAYQNLKTEYEEFKDSVSSWQSAIEGMKELTVGTVEYTEALALANEQALELIKNNKDLEYTINNGQIIIDEESLKKVQEARIQDLMEAQTWAGMQEIEANNARIQADRVHYTRNWVGGITAEKDELQALQDLSNAYQENSVAVEAALSSNKDTFAEFARTELKIEDNNLIDALYQNNDKLLELIRAEDKLIDINTAQYKIAVANWTKNRQDILDNPEWTGSINAAIAEETKKIAFDFNGAYNPNLPLTTLNGVSTTILNSLDNKEKLNSLGIEYQYDNSGDDNDPTYLSYNANRFFVRMEEVLEAVKGENWRSSYVVDNAGKRVTLKSDSLGNEILSNQVYELDKEGNKTNKVDLETLITTYLRQKASQNIELPELHKTLTNWTNQIQSYGIADESTAKTIADLINLQNTDKINLSKLSDLELVALSEAFGNLNTVELSDPVQVALYDAFQRIDASALIEAEASALLKAKQAVAKINFGDIINPEDFEYLGEKYEQYFALMEDGTYKLIGQAKELNNELDKQRYQAAAKAVEEARQNYEEITNRLDLNKANTYKELSKQGKYSEDDIRLLINEGQITAEYASYLLKGIGVGQHTREISDYFNKLSNYYGTPATREEEQAAWQKYRDAQAKAGLIASDKDTLDQMLKDKVISAEEYYNNLKKVVMLEAEEQGITTESLEALQQQIILKGNLRETNEQHAAAALGAAYDIISLNEGWQELGENIDDIINNLPKGLLETSEALSQLQKILSKVFGDEWTLDIVTSVFSGDDGVALAQKFKEAIESQDPTAFKTVQIELLRQALLKSGASTSVVGNFVASSATALNGNIITGQDLNYYPNQALGNLAENILSLFTEVEEARAALSVLGIEASIVKDQFGNLVLNKDKSYVVDLFNSLSQDTLSGASNKTKSLSLLEVDDEKERYRLINDQIQDAERSLENYERTAERAFGGDKLKAYDDQLGAIGTKQSRLVKKLKEAEGYLATDRTSVSTRGFTFDAAGNIDNYNKVIERLVSQVNAYASSGNEEAYEKAKENLEAAKKAAQQYDETRETIADIKAEQQALLDQIYEINLSKIDYKKQVRLDFNDLQLEELGYDLEGFQDNVFKTTEAMGIMEHQFLIQQDTFAANRQALIDLEEAKRTGAISDEKYAAKLQELQKEQLAAAATVREYGQSLVTFYSDTLDNISAEIDRFTSKLEHGNEVLEHYTSVLGLLGKSSDYKMLDNIYQAQFEGSVVKLEATKKEYDSALLEEKNKFDEYNKAQSEGLEEEALKSLRDAADKATAYRQEKETELLSDTEATLQAAREIYENNLQLYRQSLEEIITGGTSFDKLLESMEYANSLQEEYLTTTNKIYETTSLMRTAQAAIDKTNNATAKQRLKQFINETEQLQGQTELSQYELDIQKAKYDLLLAEIALEEAQNAKTQVRLRRDAEGNFGYIYTADANEIAEAEDQLLAAQNELYNIGLEGANKYAQQYIQLGQEMTDKLMEIHQRNADGFYESTEEYERAQQEVINHYQIQMQRASELYGVALETDSRVAADAWTSNFSIVFGSMEEVDKAVKEFTEQAAKNWEEYSARQEGASATSGLSLDSMSEKIGIIRTGIEEIDISLFDPESGLFSNKKLGAQYEALANLTQHFETYGNAIKTVNEQLTTLSSNKTLADFVTETGSTSLIFTVPVGAATGGLTAAWGPEGKLLTVHENELILNSEQTDRFFDQLENMNYILSLLDLQTAYARFGGQLVTPIGLTPGDGTLEQKVHIEATFPNVTEHTEIEEALTNLVNKASQYANRK